MANFKVSLTSDGYFQNDKEFRVVVEYVKGTVSQLDRNGQREKVFGVYVPISGGAFNAAGATTRLVQENQQKGHGWGDGYRYFAAQNKDTNWLWNQNAKAS